MMRSPHKWIVLILFLGMLPEFKAQCNAGSNASIQLCEDGVPADLFAALGGSPSVTGVWTDPATGGFSGVFDPSSDAPGSYRYVVSLAPDGTSCGLPDTAYVLVGVSSIPAVSFSLDNTSGCGSVSVNFTDNSTPSSLTAHEWDFGDGNGSFADSPFHTYQDTTGCFDVSLTLSNTVGCSATDTLFDAVCVLSRPEAAFSLLVDPVLTSAPTARFVNESTGAVQYDWDVAGIGNFNTENPEVSLPDFEADYNVCLDALSADGCVDTHCRTVRVRQDKEVFVPSAFTPVEGSLNPHFRPVLTFVPDLFVLTVFDRWGGVVFETRDPAIGWNGAQQGTEYVAPDGDYTWKIRATKNSEVIERFGNVTLLR